MPLITVPDFATELEAVNMVLSAIGEAPLPSDTDLQAVTAVDVTMAISMLREALRDVLSQGWTFNTEFGYELAPFATNYPWIDTSGATTPLNIFLAPLNYLRVRITPSSSQIGWTAVDATLRQPRRWPLQAGDLATSPSTVQVFYDRAANRDGFPTASHPHLYIDPVWRMQFVDLPDEARYYITVLAARRFAARVLGSQTLVGFSRADELSAYRTLKRAFDSQRESYNIFNNSGASGFYGGRLRHASGFVDTRANPGPNF